jgi:DNA-binding CsgD family transcriptional regulator
MVLRNLGHVAPDQHDLALAAAQFAECLTLVQAMGQKDNIAEALAGLGAVAAHELLQQAVRLLGAAAALRETIGYQFDTVDQAAYDQQVAAVRAQLDPAIFDASWAAGQALSVEQAITEAEAVATAAQAVPDPQPPPPDAQYTAGLTAREVEVLGLVAQGLTTPQIADQLIISPRTVHAHLRAIYGKLDVTTRSAATRYAVEHGLG